MENSNNNEVGGGNERALGIFGWSEDEHEEMVQGKKEGQNTVRKDLFHYFTTNPEHPDPDNVVSIPKISADKNKS